MGLLQDVKRLEDVSRENTILKRAVTIQAQRLNEASAAVAAMPALKAQARIPGSALLVYMQCADELLCSHDMQTRISCMPCHDRDMAGTATSCTAIAQLAVMQVQAAQEKVHSLELANYSLAMHLRQANSSASGMHHGHDVF